MNNYQKFSIAQKYRLWSFTMFIISTIFIALSYKLKFIGYLLAIASFLLAIILDRQYKCPVCNVKFDTRIPPNKYKYCPNCSSRLLE